MCGVCVCVYIYVCVYITLAIILFNYCDQLCYKQISGGNVCTTSKFLENDNNENNSLEPKYNKVGVNVQS